MTPVHRSETSVMWTFTLLLVAFALVIVVAGAVAFRLVGGAA